MNSFNSSGCWCCNDCSKRQLNKRGNYVIPCANKADCSQYQKYLLDNKVGNALRVKASQNNSR